MSKFRSIPYAVLTSGLLVSGGAYAQSMSSIDQRQDYQQDRIERGIQSGQITRSEAARLEQGERAIDRAQARARADGVVTQQERARIDRMTDRESRDIYRQSHDSQQSWDRGQSWGHTDGRQDGWRDRDGRQNGWGQNNGQHDGWARGEHNGWDGNRPSGIERRDARQDQRINNGVRDGSLTHGEANRLERGQDHINRYEARARSDGVVTPQERGRIDQMQNNESRRIYADRHNDRTAPTTPTTPTTGTQPSHNWGNGGWSHQQQAGTTTPATGTQPAQQLSRNGGNGGWSRQQAGTTTPTTGTQPAAGTQPSRNWGNSGARMQQASAAPATPRVQQASATPATPRPTFTRTSNPSVSRTPGR
jgi:hypothetical protein